MTQEEGERLADAFKALIYARTGLRQEELVCPREKSFMTPCAARDGQLVVTITPRGTTLCVGCEADIAQLLEQEREKHAK